MRRTEIRTVAGGKDYAGKPRPTVIVQDDRFDATQSVTVCAFTTDPTEAPLFRGLIESTERNGLQLPCRLMVDKITTVPKSKLGDRLGVLQEQDVLQLNRAIMVFLRTGERRNRCLILGGYNYGPITLTPSKSVTSSVHVGCFNIDVAQSWASLSI